MKLLKVKSVEEVNNLIYQNFEPITRQESIGLVEGWGRVLATDILSSETIPPFSRSSVDGYAVFAEDTHGASESLPAFLALKEEIKMGQIAGEISLGEARYIPTGGMVPTSATAVVMVEYTEVMADQVMVYRPVATGENIIQAGDDVQTGETILKSGAVLREGEISALASLGVTEVQVYQKPLIGILSTGDELVPSSTAQLALGQIRDSNSVAIASMAKKFGAQVIFGGIVKDDYQQLLTKAQELLAQVDILIISGGSSVGTLDFTAQIIKELGQDEILVEGVAVKPGKPTLLAKADNKGILGLPGHPVSAMMIFNYFGEKILNVMAGHNRLKVKGTIRAQLTRNIPSSAGRTDWVMVRLSDEEGETYATPVFGKSSLVKTLTNSHGYVEIPMYQEGVEKGKQVEVILWN